MSTLPGQAQCQLGLTFYRAEIPIRCAAPATAPRSPETRRLHNHRPAAAREAAGTCTHRAEAGPGVLGLNVQSMYALEEGKESSILETLSNSLYANLFFISVGLLKTYNLQLRYMSSSLNINRVQFSAGNSPAPCHRI